ncbi:hypothetical protein Cgig2_013881 [Carnegiea gigantea]|uniref:Uncharacterized protein n=1 Tax=Carnegiea gigantea TaxID=171969 RepID=A0A9Q1GI41_9CARY|nr:hypothetical protein Cgig2_013881 [Carnegiea gigantea]
MPSCEDEDVDDNASKKEGEEEMHIQEAPKAVPKAKKLALKSEGKQPFEQKDAQLSTGDVLQEEKISSSGQDVQMAPQQQPLKYEKDEYSFSSMVAHLNEAQSKAVRSTGLASFLKLDLKQIPGKFSKWLVESFDPYFASFVLSDGQRFIATPFDAYVILGVPFGGRKIMGEQQKIEHIAPELTRMPEFILTKKDGGESFKRNFIIYLVNCSFG